MQGSAVVLTDLALISSFTVWGNSNAYIVWI